MKKLTSLILIAITIFGIGFALLGNKNVVAQDTEEPVEVEEISSFELFWPIVAGKVRGNALYPLKSLKEKIQVMLIFGEARKAEYYSTLSTKRIVEYEKLVLVDKDFQNTSRTLDDYKKYVNMGSLIREYEKQERFINWLLTKVDESQKVSLQEAKAVLELRMREMGK